MCLILLAYRIDADFPLIIAANRDEFFERPSQSAHYWPDADHIFAGRDLKEKGTWLGVTKGGRFAAVTNWSDPAKGADGHLSRGHLVSGFLSSNVAPLEYFSSLNGTDYLGFNLVAYDGRELAIWSNRNDITTVLEPGFHGITNTGYENQWLKTKEGLRMVADLERKHDLDSLIAMLRRHSGESDIQDISHLPPRSGSPCFVLGEKFGTRTSTAVVFDSSRIAFKEQQYGPLARRESCLYESVEVERREGVWTGT